MSEDKPLPLLLTVEQAAKLLNLGRDRTWELVHSGRLPSITISPRVIRVPRWALDAWIDHQVKAR